MLLGEEMATKSTVGVDINVSDNGTTKKVVKQVQELHSSIKQAQEAASTGVKIGGTSGSRTAASMGSFPAAPAALASAYKEENTSYGVARSAVGTGAAGRDFAQQAEGLGGLVRLYATYAANIFAVGAAFTALSRAMDTTNMVKGLDQLGAASGVALGSLSKELVKATDGAISLREAMEATVKASSSGMSSENILRMGIVAKQAAQALGVDMSDAVSRISRGITKLEPELLDELGIFTRIDPAVREYSKSVNKAASSLTDFERRMAFANAVLAEGEEKFGEIKLDTNPYTKLLASIKDVSQTGLELVNRVISPLVNLLSESPTALALAIGAIGIILVKQALPAIGQFKAGLASAAEDAAALSIQKAEDAAQARAKIDSKALQIAEEAADSKVAAVDAAEKRILALQQSSLSKQSAAYKLLQKDIDTITDKDYENVEKRAKVADAAGKSTEAAAYREVITSVKAHKAAEEELVKAKEATRQQVLKDSASWGTFGQTLRAAEKAQTDATKKMIISNAAYNGSLIGVSGAIKQMRTEIGTSNLTLGKFGTTALIARGAIAALGGAITTAFEAISGVVQIIGMIVAGFALLNRWLSNTAEESTVTSSSLAALDAASNNLSNTLENIAKKKDPLEAFSVNSIKARATAIGDFTETISEAVDSSFKELGAMGKWDGLIDWTKALWGGDVESKLTERMSKGLSQVFNNIEGDSATGKAARDSIQNLLNVDDITSTTKVDKALENMSSKDRQAAIKEITKSLKQLGDEAKISAAKGTELVTSFKTLEDARTKITNSFVPKDEMSQYGNELLNTFSKLSIALEDPVQRLNAIKQLSKEILEVPGTTLDEALGVAKLAKQVENLDKAAVKYNQTKQKAAEIESALATLIGSKEKAERIGSGEQVQVSGLTREGIESFKQLKADLLEVKKLEKINLKIKTELSTEVSKGVGVVEAAQLRVFQAGAKYITDGLNVEWAKAGATIANAYASVLSGTETGVKMKASSDRAVIQAQIAQIESQRNLTIATRELAIKIAEESLSREKESSWGGEDRGMLASKEKEIANMRSSLTSAKAGNTKGLYAELSKEMSDSSGKLSEIGLDSLRFAQNMEASAAAIAGLRAQAGAVGIGERSQIFDIRTNTLADQLKTSITKLETDQKALATKKELVSENSKDYVAQKQVLELDIQAAQQAATRLALERQIVKFRSTPGGAVEADKSAKKLEDLKIQQQREAGLLAEEQRLFAINAAYRFQLELLDKVTKLDEIRLSGTKAQEDALAAVKDIHLSTADQTKSFTEEYLKQKQYELAIFKTTEEAKRAEEAATYTARNTQMRLAAELQSEIDKTGGIGSDKAKYIIEQMSAEATAYAQIIAGIKDKTAAQLSSTDALKAYNDEQSKFNTLIEDLKGLDGVFGDVGTKFADMATAFKELADSQQQYANTIKDMEFERDVETEPKKRLEWQDKINEVTAKGFKAETAGYAKTVGAAKNMFKEKTVAHKALAATEKVLRVQSLASEATTLGKQVAMWWAGAAAKTSAAVAGEAGTTTATTSGFLARLPTYIKEIYASWGKMGPWMVGAATAFIAATLLKGGGGGSAIAPPSAEQRQETQGTAMGYDSSGKLVQTSRGVFGDTGAKSESIGKSIDRIKETSIEGLKYDNRVVGLLSKINDGINNTAKSLYSIRGLREGSMFGTHEGTTKGKGLLGSGIFGSKRTTNITDSGLLITATFADLANTTSEAAIQFYEDVTTTKKKWYGSSRTRHSRNLETADQITQDYFNDIFSNATELFKELGQESGMQVADVLKSLEGVSFENLSVSLRGLKGEDLEKELNAVISSMLDQGAEAVFASFTQFANFGEGMLETVIRVTDNNKKVEQALKNIGMGDIMSQVTEQARAVPQTITETFERQNTVIEYIERSKRRWYGKRKTWVEAVARTVTEQYQETRFLTENEIIERIRIRTLEVSEALVKGAGSLEDFLSQASFYSENFLSEQERLSIVESSVSEEMRRLSITMGDNKFAAAETADEFSALIEGLDLTTVRGRETYQALMNVAPGFKTLIDAANAFADSMTTLIERVFSLTGQDEKLLASQRAKVLKDTDPGLVALQKYVFALEDLKTSEDALSDARKKLLEASKKSTNTEVSALKNVTQAMRGFIDSLKKFKDSLFLDQASILTPAQKYAESKRQFDLILATATGTATTPEEQKIKDTALGQIESAAKAFLETSRVYNASSRQYTLDFGLVTSALDSTSLALESQLTAAEQAMASAEAQELLLQGQLDALNKVDDSIGALEASLVEALSKNSSAIGEAIRLGIIAAGSLSGNTEAASTILGSLPQFAKGGLASGWSIAGENGAELIDFKTPGRVYTAEQTFGMFNGTSNANAELVQEVRMLRKEVSALRAQQSKETGHLITATYDAQHKNAEEVTDGVSKSAEKQIWAAKVASKAVLV